MATLFIGQSADLWRAGARRDAGVERVDVEGHVDVTAFRKQIGDTVRAFGVDVPRGHD